MKKAFSLGVFAGLLLAVWLAPLGVKLACWYTGRDLVLQIGNPKGAATYPVWPR